MAVNAKGAMSFEVSGLSCTQVWRGVQVCAAIFMKMLMDLWFQQGPSTAFPLALALLSRRASSAVPAARARAFDMLLNLSAHAELMRPHAGLEAGPLQDGPAAGPPPSDGSPVAEAAVSASAQSGQQVEDFRRWLRLLLYQLLELLLQASSLYTCIK